MATALHLATADATHLHRVSQAAAQQVQASKAATSEFEVAYCRNPNPDAFNKYMSAQSAFDRLHAYALSVTVEAIKKMSALNAQIANMNANISANMNANINAK